MKDNLVKESKKKWLFEKKGVDKNEQMVKSERATWKASSQFKALSKKRVSLSK